jgi:hypothetical protein
LTEFGFAVGGTFAHESDEDMAADLDAMLAMGATWIRLDLPWSSIESERGTYDFYPYDVTIAAAVERGLKVLAILTYTPPWARPPGTTDKHGPTTFGGSLCFGVFAAVAALHFQDQVAAWEIWNEPNISGAWGPKPNPAMYGACLRNAAKGLRWVLGKPVIVSGGLSPAADVADGTRIAPATFLSALYKQPGTRAAFTAMGIHPYSFPALPTEPGTESWNTWLRMPALYDVMVAHGDGGKRLWLTEWGAPTQGLGSVSEDGQAAIFDDGWADLASKPWAGPVMWYSLRDIGESSTDREQNFGCLLNDGAPKVVVEHIANRLRAP